MKRKLALAGMLGLSLLAVEQTQAVYWDTFNGQVSAYLFNDNNITWDAARVQAGTVSYLGATGHLATIHSTAENNLLATIGRNRGTRNIGLTDSIATSTLDNLNLQAALGTSEGGNTSGQPLPAAGLEPVAGQRGFGWKWVTGEPVTFQNWAGGEPNDSSSEDAGQIRNDGLWNDDDAGASLGDANDNFRSIIEFNPAAAPVSKWKVTTYKAQDNITIDGGFNVNNLAAANTLRNSAPGSTNRELTFGVQGVATGTHALANFSDSGNTGNFTGDALPPGFVGANDDFVLVYKNSFTVAADNTFTFGFRTDDGGSIRILGGSFGTTTNTNGQVPGSDTLSFAATRGQADTFGQIFLAAGTYDLEFTWFEDGGGASAGEAFFATGAFTTFAGNGFKLLGDNTGDLTFANAANNVEVHKGRNAVIQPFPDINNLTDAFSVINGGFTLVDISPGVAGDSATGFTDVINFIDGNANVAGSFHQYGTTGLLGNDTPLGVGGTDDFVIEATGFVKIDQSGVWTFGIIADDGYQLALDLDNNGTYETIVTTRNTHVNTAAAFTNILLNEGIYGIRYVAYERGGDWGNELFAAFNPLGQTITSVTQLPFALVGDVPNGGLRVGQSVEELTAVPEPASLTLLAFAAAGLVSRRRRTA